MTLKHLNVLPFSLKMKKSRLKIQIKHTREQKLGVEKRDFMHVELFMVRIALSHIF